LTGVLASPWRTEARDVGVGSVSRKKKATRRDDGKAKVGQPVRPVAGCAIPASRRTLGGHVAARRRENAARGAGRKVAIHAALLAAAG